MRTPKWVLHWEYWAGMSAIQKAFESVNFGLRTLKHPVPIYLTPNERAQALTGIIPRMAIEIKLLLDEHQTSLYTSRVANVTQARQAASNLRKQVIIEWLRYLVTGKLR
jgi:hypothetical protein